METERRDVKNRPLYHTDGKAPRTPVTLTHGERWMYMSEVEVYVVLHLGPVLQEEADLCWEVDRDFAGGRFGVLIHVRVEKEETGAFITARKLRGVVSEAVPLGRGEGGRSGTGS